MTIIIWRLMFLASAALCVIGLFVLFITRLLKNKYFHDFELDELFKSKKTSNSKNEIYFTSGETRKYVRKYVICKTAFDKFLVCNYVRAFSDITYYVLEYTAHKRVISVKCVKEFDTGTASKIISLNKRCKYVNVVIGTAEGTEINSNVIRPIPLTKIRLYAFLKSFIIFTGLFAVRHILIEILGGSFAKFYLTDLLNYVAVGASFVLAVVSYFITTLSLRRKNARVLNGGALEYEFV